MNESLLGCFVCTAFFGLVLGVSHALRLVLHLSPDASMMAAFFLTLLLWFAGLCGVMVFANRKKR